MSVYDIPTSKLPKRNIPEVMQMVLGCQRRLEQVTDEYTAEELYDMCGGLIAELAEIFESLGAVNDLIYELTNS